jgi:hypothetical protein
MFRALVNTYYPSHTEVVVLEQNLSKRGWLLNNHDTILCFFLYFLNPFRVKRSEKRKKLEGRHCGTI